MIIDHELKTIFTNDSIPVRVGWEYRLMGKGVLIGYQEGQPTSSYWNGWIWGLRMTKGVCRYPGGTTFTPPTAPFPNS